MKLEVGMYVRTKRGQIGKIITIGKYNITIEFNGMYQDIISKENIIKASFNIIDLIEVGDYINGHRVEYIDDCKGAMREFYYDYENPNEDVGHWEEEIKTIVTKEQFEQISYEVSE